MADQQLEKLKWHTESRKIKELIPWEHNPRKISEAQKEKLIESLEKFDLAEIPAIDTDNKIVAGHQRVMILMLKKRGEEEIDVRIPNRKLTREEFAEYNLRSNKNTGEWDWERLKEMERELLKRVGFAEMEIKRGIFSVSNSINRSLIEDYIIPPFSVFDARQGYWTERKKEWKKQLGETIGSRDQDAEHVGSIAINIAGKEGKQISQYDPVMLEVLYTWYVERGGLIIDPFAGSSMAGLIASILGYKFVGTDIWEGQIKKNEEKAKELGQKDCEWHYEGGENIGNFLTKKARMMITDPPYFNLERYDLGNEKDISNAADYKTFLELLEKVMMPQYENIEDGGWAVVKMANVRNEEGHYYNLVGDTIRIMQKAGFVFYNDIVLLMPMATAGLRARRTFEGGKKVVKTHQNVLTFWKKGTEVKINPILKQLIESGQTAKAHENVLMFKKP